MSRIKIALLLALVGVVAAFGLASAQIGYSTPFITSITFQNVGTADATVQFNFYNEKSASPITVSRPLPTGAGSSLFVGSLSELPANFSGSAVLSSDQPIVATVVQLPQSTTVLNRPLSNGFSSGDSQVLIATVLKNQFNSTTRFSVQNVSTGNADIKVQFFAVGSTTPIELTEAAIPGGAAKYYDVGQLTQIPSPFNGSAIVTANVSGSTTPAPIVASAMELSTNGPPVSAFEGVTGGSTTVYMPSALCDAFGGQRSFYAVQNTSSTTPVTVTVTYNNGNNESAPIGAGNKRSFNGCGAGNTAGFNGSSTITSQGAEIVVIGKVSGVGISSAFLGESAGTAKLALPYVRWASDANYGGGKNYQRTFISIQNVGNTELTNVTVQYLDKNGTVAGTHTIPSIPAGEKRNSNPGLVVPPLNDFGTPDTNPGGGFGGAAVITGSSGAELISVARVTSKLPDASLVGEDYNGIPVQ
jgi:hypothetical protein